jgi:hypothetical protein
MRGAALGDEQLAAMRSPIGAAAALLGPPVGGTISMPSAIREFFLRRRDLPTIILKYGGESTI